MDKGGSTNTNTITKSDPWEKLQPYLLGQGATAATPGTPGHYVASGVSGGAYDRGGSIGGSSTQTWVPGTPATAATAGTPGLLPEAARLYQTDSPQTKDALAMTEARARAGSPINTANASMFSDTLSGKYLDPNTNPYLKGTFDQGADAVQGRINSMFSGSNRIGSGLQQDTYQKNLNDLATNIYGGNYQQERARQMQAGALAPGIANQDYFDAQQLMGVGNYDQQKLATYAGLLGGVNSGGQSNSQGQSPYFTNPLATGLGAGLSGLAMYNALTPAAAGAGAAGVAAGTMSPYIAGLIM